MVEMISRPLVGKKIQAPEVVLEEVVVLKEVVGTQIQVLELT